MPFGLWALLANEWPPGLDTFPSALLLGGTLGAILTGVFATRACWDIDGLNKLGLIEGQTRVLIGQVVAVLITWVFAAVATFILLKILDATMGLRVTQEQEMQGIDVSQHGEEGYIFI